MQIHQCLWMFFHLWEITPLPFDLHHESWCPCCLWHSEWLYNKTWLSCVWSQSTVFIPEQCTEFCLLWRIKHLRWDLRHLSLQPNTYQYFNRKYWRCCHTHPISQSSGLPGNRFPYLKSPSRFWHLHCPFWNTARGWWPREGGLYRQWLFNLLKQCMKIGISIIMGGYGEEQVVWRFSRHTCEKGAEPCRFSTISEQR